MISKSEMLPFLVKACPSFADKWKIHKQEYSDEENFLPYIALGEFNVHLVELYKTGKTNEFSDIFNAVERLHIEGEHYVREAATIGLLEGLQNIAGNNRLDPQVFFEYLRPVSAMWWLDLNKFWNGEIEFVGQTVEKTGPI